MKLLYTLIFCSFLAPLKVLSQNYGQVSFHHSLGSVKMCDALTIEQHTLHPGSIMVGYKALSPAGNAQNSWYNFAIDRTGPGGNTNNMANTFHKSYQVHANPSDKCEPKTRPVLTCAGVSIIETNANVFPGNQQAHFAITGAFSDGCYFGLLDAAGNCIYATSFLFPGKNYPSISQPKIIECRNPGEYIICGSFDNTMYAICLNTQGVVIWNQLYLIEGEPRDMMPCAFGANKDKEFIVVGKTTLDGANYASDGFIMKMDQSNGSVIVFKRLHIWSANQNTIGDQHFNTIAVQHKENLSATNPNLVSTYGYFLGGYTEPFTYNLHGNLLLYHVDSTLTFQNLYVMTSPYDTTGGEIVDIVSRKVNSLNKHVYYSLLKLDSGMSVLRTDRFISYNSSTYKEFHYPAPPGVFESNKIGLMNTPLIGNHGLQVYGTRYFNSTPSNNMISAYFNGVTTCNSDTNTTIFTNAATMHFIDTIVPFGGLRQCKIFHIMSFEDEGFADMHCGITDSVAGGNNSKTMYTPPEEKTERFTGIKMFPNPTKNHTTLEYALYEKGKINIQLVNLLGQTVTVIESAEKEAGTHQTEIHPGSIGLEKGVYFIYLEMGAEIKTIKLIYEGE